MVSNLQRFNSDLERLIEEAGELELSLLIKAHSAKEVAKALKPDASEDEINAMQAGFKKLPSFASAYEGWYSEALAVIRQVLPDRLTDFKDHFEVPKGRKDVTFASYRIQDALKGLRATRYDEVIADEKAAVAHFKQQWAILKAAKRRFQSSLFEIRQLVQADLFDSEIDSARHLLKNKFLRASGAIAGVILEKHLRQVCDDHNVKVTKRNPGINDLNQLLKDANVIDVPQWRQISLLGDIRNVCDHNKQKEPTEQQVSDLIDGTDRVLKTIS